MKTLIVGGGKIGYYLLKTLLEKEHEVVIVEKDSRQCDMISEEVDTEVILGDGTDTEVLVDAGIQDAEIVAAVTGSDEVNLVVCKLAKNIFQVNKTIARVNNPKNMAMFTALGVDNTVCSTQVIAKLIEYEVDKENVKVLHTFEKGQTALLEVKIGNTSAWKDIFVKDLYLPKDCVITSIMRGNEVIFPRGNTKIEEDDSILILINNSDLGAWKKHFTQKVN